MSSEIEGFKTNDFLRRRKLRLQQVREQSKEVAKRIRQRAKGETLQSIADIEAAKEKEYLNKQDKFIKKLEILYTKSVNRVGTGHQKAAELLSKEDGFSEKVDLSQLRGKEATAELRRKNQEKLDERKKILDRKLQAREVANEISREKSTTVANKLTNKPLSSNVETADKAVSTEALVPEADDNGNKDSVIQDMTTQWELAVPKEWDPVVPNIDLAKEDVQVVHDNEPNPGKSKRLDLFALSDEMPASLRGGLIDIPERENDKLRPSLTLVSEYLQNRALRLREHEPITSHNNDGQLRNIKETIQKTRTSKIEGNALNSCCVLDEQVIPVPSWRSGSKIDMSSHTQSVIETECVMKNRLLKSCNNCTMNRLLKPKSTVYKDCLASPILRRTSPFRRDRRYMSSGRKSPDVDKSKSSEPSTGAIKKNPVTIYTHSTRDTRNIPLSQTDNIVVRDLQTGDVDAYTLAVKESCSEINTKASSKDVITQKKAQDTRNRIAIAKHNVEKEFRNTMEFLNSLPKDKGKPIKTAFMDERTQEMTNARRQQKMQQEYKKIEKECRKHCQHKSKHRSRNETLTPFKDNDDFTSKDFQYSWMPVPESDENLAIHTIPTAFKQQKTGNTVKFKKVDSYHEYRSRHKHTPPTKDSGPDGRQASHDKAADENYSTDSSSLFSDTSSVENLGVEAKEFAPKKRSGRSHDLSSAERVVVYKILDAKKDKKETDSKKTSKLLLDIAKSLQALKESRHSAAEPQESNTGTIAPCNSSAGNGIPFEQLDEGVYKAVNTGENVASLTTCFTKGKNVTTEEDIKLNKPCGCYRKKSAAAGTEPPVDADEPALKPKLDEKESNLPEKCQVHTTVSSSSYMTATNDKGVNALPDGGFVKLVDDSGKETGKFYVGATGFLHDDAYEVVIQLRKKDGDTLVPKKNTTSQNDLGSQISLTVQNPVRQNCDKLEEVQEKNNSNLKIVEDQVVPPVTEAVHHNIVNQNDSKDMPSKDHSEDKRHDIGIQGSPPIMVEEYAYDKDSRQRNVRALIDRGINTHYVDQDIPKHEFITRATSTSTQTIPDSPSHRPQFVHMSSSTSTAYMSPPEKLLPKYFGHEHTDDDVYDSIDSSEQQNEDELNVYQGAHNNECKKCFKSNYVPKDQNIKETNSITPPNSPHTGRAKQTAKSLDPGKLPKYQCQKCTRIKDSGTNTIRTQSSAGLSLTSHYVIPSLCVNKNQIRCGLNPVIKKYIDKLLQLNKNGLKAIDVLSQDCSAVPTPNSSIINIPCNINKTGLNVENKISLEQIKQLVKSKFYSDRLDENKPNICKKNVVSSKISKETLMRIRRRNNAHRVKILNMSKAKDIDCSHIKQSCKRKRPVKSATFPKNWHAVNDKNKLRSKSLPTPRQVNSTKTKDNCKLTNKERKDYGDFKTDVVKETVGRELSDKSRKPTVKKVLTSEPHYSIDNFEIYNAAPEKQSEPTNIATQTNQIIESDNLLKLADDKLQNMEKIADLTEKCTKRLSNLARVLEKVRRTKSLSYNQVSSSENTSDTDPRSDENIVEKKDKLWQFLNVKSLQPSEDANFTSKSPELSCVVSDIPRPRDNVGLNTAKTNDNDVIPKNQHVENLKNRGKPPPALSRINQKHGHEFLVPHELSTVLEVDSPMSVRLKNQTVPNESLSNPDNIEAKNPDLLESNKKSSTIKSSKKTSSDSSDDTKMQMLDLKQFNQIMLQPFITIQDYVDKYNVEPLDEGSNLDDIPIPKDDVINDDFSSLHSDGSLPDVVSELLKRNLITEPFKFDTISNLNSTTSESTFSLLALSKVQKDKNKLHVMFPKEPVTETSDTLSVSSNPDLENAFKQLGMGWASSTLKKTKERLALSSSSNTSSSSLAQFKLKTTISNEMPNLVTDSISLINVSKKQNVEKNDTKSKSVELQTSLLNSMTVKEFLTQELADKITFNNKSNKTEKEFVSLYETKMPEEMKHSINHDNDRSSDSQRSGVNVRARTSTPVQLFKSMTYHSSSSSNMSNGLFSNADDLSSVKGTSNSVKNHSTSEKDDLTIPNYSLKMRKGTSDNSKSE